MKPIIEGDDDFKIKTLEALIVITYKAEEKFNNVLKYIGRIKQGEQSGVHESANPPTFIVGKSTYFSQKEWYASEIVHSSYHSKLYHDYIETSKTESEYYSGEKAEYACLNYQISFLEEIGAEQYLIDTAKSKKNLKNLL